MIPFSKARKEKAKLTGLGQRLFSGHSFKESASPQDWLDAIKTIQTYSRYRKSAAGLIMFVFILCLLVVTVGFIFETILAAIAMVVAIVCLILFCFLGKPKFPVAAANVLCPIIATLREDMKPSAGLEIALDMSGSTASRKKKSTRKVPRNELGARVRSRTEHFYEDPWLIIRGKLIDQTAFQIIVQISTREAKTVKRSRSGKTKHKTKYKHKTKLSVTLKPPLTAGQVNPPPINALCPTIIKEREDGFSIVASVQASSEGRARLLNVHADQLLEMFASAMARYKTQ